MKRLMSFAVAVAVPRGEQKIKRVLTKTG